MEKKSDNKIEKIRHSLSHVMALAVQELYPGVKFGIGPAIDNGFYYDFDFSDVILSPQRSEGRRIPAKEGDSSPPAAGQNDAFKLAPDDLPKIEKKMRELLKKGLKFEKKEVSVDEAEELFKDQPYKLELIEEITSPANSSPSLRQLAEEGEDKGGGGVSIYSLGNFTDLCKGPHIGSTKEIDPKAFKLDKIAGAYWRGDEKKPMLTRIYGLAFLTGKDLNSFLKQREEAEKRDHRKLGAQLDLFSFHQEGPGFAFWHPKGKVIWEAIINYWRELHQAEGYQEISTPIILNRELWEKSGHWEHYKENMYFTKIDEQDYAVKPMNCPGGVLIYKTQLHSYKELPLRVSELGLVHRHERSGTLHGLFRVRSFTQDDAHIYCLPEQIEAEVKGVIGLAQRIYQAFGFNQVKIELSTRPKKSIGTDEMWQKAEKALKTVLEKEKIVYQLNEGDGAFYGPKIDFHIADCLSRTWQCGTIQLDFAIPEALDVNYIDQKGKKQRPVMLHRTIYGSLERFTGILLEHYAGSLPLWLSPVQVRVLPITKEHRKYGKEVLAKLKQAGLRAEINLENETMGKKIREGELAKIPYLLVVGDKEVKSNKVAVRHHNKDLGPVPLLDFIKKAKIEITNKK